MNYEKPINDLNVKELKLCLSSLGVKKLSGRKGSLKTRLFETLRCKNLDPHSGKFIFSDESDPSVKFVSCESDDSDESDEQGDTTEKCIGDLRNKLKEREEREKELMLRLKECQESISKLQLERASVSTIYKPNLVSSLNKEDLKGIAAYSKLNSWFSEVELFCSDDDRNRVRGAYARVDDAIKSVITGSEELNISSCSWEQLKSHFKNLLLPKQTFQIGRAHV